MPITSMVPGRSSITLHLDTHSKVGQAMNNAPALMAVGKGVAGLLPPRSPDRVCQSYVAVRGGYQFKIRFSC